MDKILNRPECCNIGCTKPVHLISYSSTAIEESLIYNKTIIIYSDYKNYKHINYKFKKNKIIYSNQNSIKNDIRNINISETIDYKINW